MFLFVYVRHSSIFIDRKLSEKLKMSTYSFENKTFNDFRDVVRLNSNILERRFYYNLFHHRRAR